MDENTVFALQEKKEQEAIPVSKEQARLMARLLLPIITEYYAARSDAGETSKNG